MFQGADVSGLDKMAQKAQEGADYAKKVAMALKILVRALKAMSWTGWAAGYVIYLEGTVIPWVEATGEALENFAKVLRMASAVQKAVSQDSPQVAIPATAYTSPQLPAGSAVNAPSLTRPDTAVTGGPMPTIAVGDGAVVVIPISIGGTASSLGQTAAQGGAGQVTTPGGVHVSWGGGTGASGTSAAGIAPQTTTTSHLGPVGQGSYSSGRVSVPAALPVGTGSAGAGSTGAGSAGGAGVAFGLGPGIGGLSGSAGPGAGGSVPNGSVAGGSVSGGSAVNGSAFNNAAVNNAALSSAGLSGLGGSGSGGSGSGGAFGGGSAAGSAGGGIGGSGVLGAGSSGSGSLGSDSTGSGGTSGSTGGGGLGSGSGGTAGSGGATGPLGSSSPLGSGGPGAGTSGDPTVRATPVASGVGGGPGLEALGAPGALVQDSSVNPAALAAPLGLAGLGAAGLGALRARGNGDTSGGEELLDPADD